MAEFDNPAMRGLGGQSPLLGAPSPYSGYNLLNSGNQQLDMMFTMYAPQFLSMFGLGGFLPQQYPAQNIMDQMVSAKYMRAMAAAEESSRARGAEILTERLIKFRGNFDHTKLSPMGAAQFNTFASVLNNRAVMPLLEGIIGPQNVEDFLFGRRGDPTQLQRAINNIGFYRPDSVTGGRMMSEASLEQFSNQIYDNLYGPDADLNDISGFSAGRVGGMLTDLARRGLLPQSMSRISNEQRGRELANLGFDTAAGRFNDATLDRSIFGDTKELDDREAALRQKETLTPEENTELAAIPAKRASREAEISAVRQALKDDLPTEEIAELAGGADTIRRIDASRVANSLKGYSEAISAVRQIFGDNGMGNAPMSQLIAAMEALTQNSMSAMSPAKIENLMRRTQMASREGGVSLEALMGLSARSGALAQQRGLTPEIAAFTNVMAMEYAASMRENTGGRAAFGRMDPDKTLLFLAEAGLNAEDSTVGRQLGALARIVESGGETYKESDAAKMLSAIRRGETSFVNAAGDTVNIAESLGQNSRETVFGLLQNLGVSTGVFDALVRDRAGTQEFQGFEGPFKIARQAAEYKAELGRRAASRGQLGKEADQAIRENRISSERVAAISASFAENFGRDVIDLVDNTQTPEERLNTLYQSFRRSIAQTTGKQGQAAIDAADADIQAIFGTGEEGQKKVREFLLGQLAAAGADLGQRGITMPVAQDVYSARQVAAGIARSSANNLRAGINISGSDGSNPLQRFSDALSGDLGGQDSFLEAILNPIDSTVLENQLLEEVIEGSGSRDKLKTAFDQSAALYKEITVDTPEERQKLVKSATESSAGFGQFVAQVTESFGADKNKFTGKTLLTDEDLREKLEAANSLDLSRVYRELRLGEETDSKETMVQALMANSGESGMRALQDAKILDNDVVTAKAVSEFILNEQVRLYASAPLDEKERAEFAQKKMRVEAFSQLGEQLADGRATGKTIAASFGVTDKKVADLIDSYIGKDGSIGGDEFSGKLDSGELSLSAEQRDNIDAMARFAKQANAMGGLEALSGASATQKRVATARMAAIHKAIELGDIKKDSPLAKVVRDETELGKLRSTPEEARTEEQKKRIRELRDREISEEEKIALDAVTRGNAQEFDAAVRGAAIKTPKKELSTVAREIGADAEKMGATAGGGGIVEQITAALSGALDTALDGLKVEVTKLPEGFGTQVGVGIGAGIVSEITRVFSGGVAAAVAPAAASAPAAATSGPIELRGTVTLAGLDKLIANLQGDTTTDTAPGGVPVTLQSPPRAPTTVRA